METRTYVRDPAPPLSSPDPAFARRPLAAPEGDSWLTRTDVARLFQVSLNDFRIGSVGGKVGVPPDIAAGRLQRLGDTASDRFVGSRIADEYVRRATPHETRGDYSTAFVACC